MNVATNGNCLVTAHHEEVLGNQRRTQLGMPSEHLGAQPHHEPQRATTRCAERLRSAPVRGPGAAVLPTEPWRLAVMAVGWGTSHVSH
jgi:hypothetical protein